ncbi:sensor histidine kinase [Sinorhizobium mexicanum]|uniref:sensor histidine kinase n=1 Tax=Sinorhizobium mexicanum TaxID=375549 RepID=UPI0015DFBDB2|nr:ATP-binding protein [Sinorhizobium mexicanum]MBP1881876.1 signal transduction histidine kinase [Sinorhizobium mexicanum]
MAAITFGVVAQSIDGPSGLQSVAPLFYVAGMLPAAGTNGGNRLSASAVLCAMLAFASISLRSFADGVELLAAWGTIVISACLISAHQRVGVRLETAAAELEHQARRFKQTFDLSPVALLEQDFTEIVEHLHAIKASGVVDLAKYARDNPSFGPECARRISTRAVNQAAVEMLGAASPNELLGGLHRFIPEDASLFIEALQALMDGRERYEGLARLRGPRGDVSTAYVAIRFPIKRGGVARVIVGMIDVTERQRMLSELREAQAALTAAKRFSEMGALSATITHELSQPIAGMMMNAQTSLRWLREKGDIRSAVDSLERVLRDARRARDILEFTRSRLSGDTGTQADDVDVESLVKEVAQIMQDELRAANVRLEVSMEHGSGEISGPRVELQQVLVNLVSNALQALRDADAARRRIQLKTSSDGRGAITFTVADCGPGIPESVADRLFAPLFTTRPDGMGMGLSIAKNAVERRGGRIRAYNLLDGAVFEFTLPALGASHELVSQEAAS